LDKINNIILSLIKLNLYKSPQINNLLNTITETKKKIEIKEQQALYKWEKRLEIERIIKREKAKKEKEILEKEKRMRKEAFEYACNLHNNVRPKNKISNYFQSNDKS